jgi:hypothetical protein
MLLEQFSSTERRMFRKALQGARRRARKKNLPFCLDIPTIREIYLKQDGNCFYSGIKMNIVKQKNDRLHDEYKMTIDCVEPSSGYIKDNVVLCLYCINSFKQRMKKDQMFDICIKMLEHQKSNI